MRVAIAGTNILAYWLGHFLRSHPSHQFVILSRSPKPALTHDGLPVIVVNFNNEAELVQNLTGFDLVISVITVRSFIATPMSKLSQALQGQTQMLLIDAAWKAHVTQMVHSEYSGLQSSRTRVLSGFEKEALNGCIPYLSGLFHG